MEEKTDLRIVKTYKALSDTFMEMMEEKKFDDITVNELCERAMVRRATFYKHFEDKYDFFGFFIRRIKNGFLEKIPAYEKSDTDDTPFAYYIYITKRCVGFIKEHEKMVRNAVKSNMFPTLLEIFLDEVYGDVVLDMKEMEKKGTKFVAAPEILSSFFIGGIIQSIRFWMANPNAMSEEKLIEGICAVLNSAEVII